MFNSIRKRHNLNPRFRPMYLCGAGGAIDKHPYFSLKGRSVIMRVRFKGLSIKRCKKLILLTC